MYKYQSCAQLKSCAKGQLLGNYAAAISILLIQAALTFLLNLVLDAATDFYSLPGIILYYALNIVILLITSLFLPGVHRFYMNLANGWQLKVADVFYGFTHYTEKTLVIILVTLGLLLLCAFPGALLGGLYASTGMPVCLIAATLLGIIGAICMTVISLQLSQVFFLMMDFPSYSAMTLLKMSRECMQGQKGRLFYIKVSFLPLILLSMFSCGLGLLWLHPYMYATDANFYFDVIRGKQAASPKETIDVAV